MVEVDRSVRLDQHQRAGLVESGGADADADFDRRQCQPLPRDAMAVNDAAHPDVA